MLDELAREGYRFDRSGSTPSGDSAFRCTAKSIMAACGWSCARAGAVVRDGRGNHAGITVRFVDSSVERLQIKSRALCERHVVTCDGRRLPLTATGAPASSSPACASRPGRCRRAASDRTRPCAAHLRHLDRGATARWEAASITSLTRAAEQRNFPVNSYEAEARRRARFQEHGHTPGYIPYTREEYQRRIR